MADEQARFDPMAAWGQMVQLYMNAWTEALGMGQGAEDPSRAANVLRAALERMQAETERAERAAFGEFASPLPPGTGPRLVDLAARIERVAERVNAIEAAIREVVVDERDAPAPPGHGDKPKEQPPEAATGHSDAKRAERRDDQAANSHHEGKKHGKRKARKKDA